jgi:hypothetical protein
MCIHDDFKCLIKFILQFVFIVVSFPLIIILTCFQFLIKFLF